MRSQDAAGRDGIDEVETLVPIDSDVSLAALHLRFGCERDIPHGRPRFTFLFLKIHPPFLLELIEELHVNDGA